MIKKILFSSDSASLDQAHAGGGCLLPSSYPWPKDAKGAELLHLLSIPVGWINESINGWVSVFTPFSTDDPFLHWEELTSDGDNDSVVIFHDNSGVERNEYSGLTSQAKRVSLSVVNEGDSDKNFESKIYGIPAWLQDKEAIIGHECLFAINGDDFDVVFEEEPGIFSDGVVYVFLKNDFHVASRPSAQGLITFQFT
ncbi:hypothetical protein KDW78_16370 [Burkholderia cenocepacia]|uniref:hypothetical protein n=1 Tax=Burkholderia cenocepacia TaxID=95486 RepID=UPI001588AD64|nr:hypothetical protein [Burkholderia cenocepacia]MBR7955455.1 hypothetical protein [Burkholderia cenocepacia]